MYISLKFYYQTQSYNNSKKNYVLKFFYLIQLIQFEIRATKQINSLIRIFIINQIIKFEKISRSLEMAKAHQQSILNSLIYNQLNIESPSRYEMIKFSTWRIYLYNQLQSLPTDRADTKKFQEKYSKQFPQLAISEDRKKFYDFLYKPSQPTNPDYKQDQRYDNISHFVCRMLYCQEQNTNQTFIQMQRKILQYKIRRMWRDNNIQDRQLLMQLMKKMLAIFKGRQSSSFYNVPQQQWQKTRNLITFSILIGQNRKQQQYAKLYAKLPFEEAEAGIRKRRSFIRNGFVYANTQTMIDIILTNYQHYLRKRLQKIRPVVQDLIVQDVQNQFSSFLISTIKQINQQGMQQTKFNGKFNLTLKNIQSLTKLFPPCMLNLNQQLKLHKHLKHDGRRQLWGFFKACGMDVHDNKQYFRKHLEGKVTASQMKTHIYNIQHAYGLQGKKKAENAWKCRNIITGTAPKKGEHHGCPFYHWRSQQLSDFLRKNYRLTQQKLKQVIAEKQQKRFQVACGRLFEYSEINHYESSIPAQITAKLGRAPYLYYQAGMQLRQRRLKETQNKGTIVDNKTSIDF